jgi:hypothetical protein
MNACFCTLAIHRPYRERARLLCGDAPNVPWVVLTDEPEDFEGLGVRAVRHVPTGPMAIDFLGQQILAADSTGGPAYHDKRFALQEALKEFDTAIFLDADTRISSLPQLPKLRPGITVTKALQTSIADHLTRWGTERRPMFEQLAVYLGGGIEMLNTARWCFEALFAITKDGNEDKFLDTWQRSAEFLQSKGLFTGEGGVIGLAAVCAGWTIDFDSLDDLAASIQHEGRGPKAD